MDVNIHPAKREVKFHHERDVRRILTRAVQETLLEFHQPKMEAKTLGQADVGTAEWDTVDAVTAPDVAVPEPLPAQQELGNTESIAALSQGRDGEQMLDSRPALDTQPVQLSSPAFGQAEAQPVPLLRVPLRLLGVVGRLYVVLESDKGMVLMDQHAAHERVLYEQMLRRMETEGSATSQKLLLPETVELPPKDAKFLKGTWKH